MFSLLVIDALLYNNEKLSLPLKESLRRYYAEDEFSLARIQVLVTLLSKPMQVSFFYLCIEKQLMWEAIFISYVRSTRNILCEKRVPIAFVPV